MACVPASTIGQCLIALPNSMLLHHTGNQAVVGSPPVSCCCCKPWRQAQAPRSRAIKDASLVPSANLIPLVAEAQPRVWLCVLQAYYGTCCLCLAGDGRRRHLIPPVTEAHLKGSWRVLQADGGTRCAAINAALLALADAGVPLRDMVAACAAGYLDKTPILDMNYLEDAGGGPDVVVGAHMSSGSIVLLQVGREGC